MIFGTVTTIEENAYPRFLQSRGIHRGRIISQACPSLADMISEDRHGMLAKREIEQFVVEAVGGSKGKQAPYLAYLACTHYGYRKAYFAEAFEGHGLEVKVLNPNELVVDDLIEKYKWGRIEAQRENDVEVSFITRYRIPETALETVAFFLDAVSPKTVRAFVNYTYAPDLF